MITMLILAAAEKLINLAVRSDKITQAGLLPLSGKVLRLTILSPELQMDVLFNEDHLRFEPVAGASLFELSGGDTDSSEQPLPTQADCHIKVANLAELLSLLKQPTGNLPIEGDYKVLMQLKQLIAGFDPDIAEQLEPLIGVGLASQLSLLINQLKGNWKHTAKHAFDDITDWANHMVGNAEPDPEDLATSNDLKQQLLKLRADVQREQARLDAIKAEQANLK